MYVHACNERETDFGAHNFAQSPKHAHISYTGYWWHVCMCMQAHDMWMQHTTHEQREAENKQVVVIIMMISFEAEFFFVGDANLPRQAIIPAPTLTDLPARILWLLISLILYTAVYPYSLCCCAMLSRRRGCSALLVRPFVLRSFVHDVFFFAVYIFRQ